MSKIELYPYQETGVKFLTTRRSCCLADDMGLGKTIQAIFAAKELKAKRVLVLCPQAVRSNWVEKLKLLSPSTAVREIKSTKAAMSGPQVEEWTIVSLDSAWRDPLFPKLKQIMWDILIVDEAHGLKNIKSKRSRSVLGKKGIALNSVRHWMLTGTPILNRPVELYPMLRTLAPQLLGPYKGYMAFTEYFCGGYNDGFGWNDTGASHLNELSGMIAPFFLRRMKTEVLKELPPLTVEKVFTLPNKALDQAVKKEKSQFNAKEFAMGEVSSIRKEVGLLKLAFAKEFIDTVLEAKDKVVVFAYHRDVITSLQQAYPNSVICTGSESGDKKTKAVKKFKTDPECKVFIGQIRAAGQGIDGLQEVCSTCVFAEMTYTPGELDQAVDRLVRIGQTEPVNAYFIVAKDSHDEDMVNVLDRKRRIVKKLIGDNVAQTTKVVEGEQLFDNIFDV